MVHSLKVNAAWHFAEYQIPFGINFECADAWETAWKMALPMIGEF
jgi:hypothetical protein